MTTRDLAPCDPGTTGRDCVTGGCGAPDCARAAFRYYLNIWSVERPAISRLCGDPQIGSAAVDAALGWVREPDDPFAAQAKLCAARNPATRAELLLDWLLDPDTPALIARACALNPAVGTHLPDLALTGVHATWALANTNVDSAYVAERWEDSPEYALGNLALPAWIANTAAARHAAALGHPHLDSSILSAATTSTSAVRRARAVRNLRLGERRLRGLAQREAASANRNPTVVALIAERLADAAWERDPLSCGAGELRRRCRHPIVQTAFGEPAGTSTQAVSVLLDASFAGTVAELLDVATTMG